MNVALNNGPEWLANHFTRDQLTTMIDDAQRIIGEIADCPRMCCTSARAGWHQLLQAVDDAIQISDGRILTDQAADPVRTWTSYPGEEPVK